MSESWGNDRRAVFLAALLFSLPQWSEASAQATHPAPAPLWGYLSVAPPRETAADVRALQSGRFSLEKAASSLDHGTSGRVIEIGFTHAGSASFYSVTIGGSDGLRYLRVDPRGGRTMAAARPPVARAQLDAEGLRILALLGSARITIEQAITAAEALTGKPAIAAGIEQLSGIPQYYVQVADLRKLGRPVIVNPETGRAARPQT